MKQVIRHYTRYLTLDGDSDVWSRELINGWFNVDDHDPYLPDLPEREFLAKYIQEETNED